MTGFVANAMVSLEQMDDMWKSGAIVDIMVADISGNEQRVNLQKFSQIIMSAKLENFKKRNQLSFVPRPDKHTWWRVP